MRVSFYVCAQGLIQRPVRLVSECASSTSFAMFFTYQIYTKAVNLKLNNLKFIFVFPNLLSSNSTIFVPIFSMYLMSVDDGTYIHIARVILPIQESSNIFKTFLTMQTWCYVGKNCSVVCRNWYVQCQIKFKIAKT